MHLHHRRRDLPTTSHDSPRRCVVIGAVHHPPFLTDPTQQDINKGCAPGLDWESCWSVVSLIATTFDPQGTIQSLTTCRLWYRAYRRPVLSHIGLSRQCHRLVRLRRFNLTPSFVSRACPKVAKAASRAGIDLPKLLGSKKRLHESAIWRRMGGSPWFSASFILTFTLAAFVRL